MRATLAVSFAFAFAACGGAARSSPPVASNTAAAASGKSRIACPAQAEVQALTRTLLGAPPTDDALVSCTALYHGGPRWLLLGWLAPADENAEGVASVLALVDAERKVALWGAGAPEYTAPFGVIDSEVADDPVPADLDGDGNDELVVVSGLSRGGFEEQSLFAWVVTPTSVELSQPLPYRFSDPDETSACSSTWKLVDGGAGTKHVEITTAPAATPAEECLAPGRHVFRLDGTKLVEVN